MRFTVVPTIRHCTSSSFLVQNQNPLSSSPPKTQTESFEKPYPMQRSHFSSNVPTGLDMALDDIISSSKKFTAYGGGGYRGRGRGRGRPGPERRFVNRKPLRTTPYHAPQPMQLREPMDSDIILNGECRAETSTKLYISNLDYGVSNEDIKLLFSEIGELKRYSIHYDKSGRSKGTAEVVYAKQSSALAAIKRYNNMKLDGKPLQIELVGVNLVGPTVDPPHFTDSLIGRAPNNVFGSGQARSRGRGVHNGIARGRLPKGRGPERFHVGQVTVEDLDADLERYRMEAVKINKEKEN